MVTLTTELLEGAAFWHEGFCLECGERSSPLPEGMTFHECEECGEMAVLPADILQRIVATIGVEE